MIIFGGKHMDAKELDTMVKAMRTKHFEIKRRWELDGAIYHLVDGLKAIGRDQLAKDLIDLYNEIENIDSDDLIEVGTFLD